MTKRLDRVRRFGWATGGELVLAGRRFAIKVDWGTLTTLQRRLGDRFGLVVAADCDQPLVVLRLGDFLRSCRFREPMITPPPVRDFSSGDSCA
jgi:hypothetical protein